MNASDITERLVADSRSAELFCRSHGMLDDADHERQLADYFASDGVNRNPGYGRTDQVVAAIQSGSSGAEACGAFDR